MEPTILYLFVFCAAIGVIYYVATTVMKMLVGLVKIMMPLLAIVIIVMVISTQFGRGSTFQGNALPQYSNEPIELLEGELPEEPIELRDGNLRYVVDGRPVKSLEGVKPQTKKKRLPTVDEEIDRIWGEVPTENNLDASGYKIDDSSIGDDKIYRRRY